MCLCVDIIELYQCGRKHSTASMDIFYLDIISDRQTYYFHQTGKYDSYYPSNHILRANPLYFSLHLLVFSIIYMAKLAASSKTSTGQLPYSFKYT